MYRRTIGLLVAVTLAASLAACVGKRAVFNPTLSGEFFPLEPNTVWTYRVKSKSQHATYVVTDKVIGQKYVPSLNVTGQVVEEYYNMERGGMRPLVYVTTKDGYLSRLSGLDYAKQDIEAPAWGRSEEGAFMPARLAPDLTWSSKIFPFGHLSGAFDINQSHRSYFDGEDIIVPGGRFSGCIRIETNAVYEGGTYAKIGKGLHLTYEDWYAPKVGLVKTVALEGGSTGPEMERVELLKFANPSLSGSESTKPTSSQ